MIWRHRVRLALGLGTFVLVIVSAIGVHPTPAHTEESQQLLSYYSQIDPIQKALAGNSSMVLGTSTEAFLPNVSGTGAQDVREISIADQDSAENKPFEYEVQSGDTLSDIAEKFGLKLETVLWANGFKAKDIIRPSQIILLLPVDGVLHKVGKGETISKIAVLHKGDVRETVAYNRIDDATKIHIGDQIIVPGGKLLTPGPPKSQQQTGIPVPYISGLPAVSVPAGSLLWPTTARNITQRYSAAHRGIDIADGGQPPIFAAHSGTVEFAGSDGDWGSTILLRGDNGYVTRYSHAAELYVSAGQQVEAGMTIGKIGNTGRVRGRTGLHLDFRVYKNGVH
ncbi:MAG: peptidoglycan DD-metalloendopeptidase family protein [bacterium]|nr:peptidoglycan DD-metalloendopeptidase family protein [bacterium]